MPKIHDVASIVCLLLLSCAIKVEKRYSLDTGEANSCSGSHVGCKSNEARRARPQQFLSRGTLSPYFVLDFPITLCISRLLCMHVVTPDPKLLKLTSPTSLWDMRSRLWHCLPDHTRVPSVSFWYLKCQLKQVSAERKSLIRSLCKETLLLLFAKALDCC